MGNIENRIKKIEGVLGKEDDLSFKNYFGELLGLVSDRTRGVPSAEKEYDPEYEAAADRLQEKYLTQREPGLSRFKEDYAKSLIQLEFGTTPEK